MIRLFVKFSLLAAVVFMAGRWSFYSLLEDQIFTDRQRVFAGLTEVHLGGLEIVASELRSLDEEDRNIRCSILKDEFQIPIQILPVSDLSREEQSRLKQPNGFIFGYRNDLIDYLGVALDRGEYLRLGPIADRNGEMIENEVQAWLRMLARKIERSEDVPKLLEGISNDSRILVNLIPIGSLPLEALDRLNQGKQSAFYGQNNQFYVATPLGSRQEILSLGPLPKIKDLAINVAGRSLVFWFLVLSAATAWLVYEVSKKFRFITIAAKKISEGHFDTRVDESRAGEAVGLAKAFNLMAARNESLIKSKKELLQVVSHELRTPLSRLRFAADLLEDFAENDGKKARLKVIHQSIDDLESIVEEVLDYVRNHDAAPTKTPEWIDVRQLIETLIHPYEIENPEINFLWAESDHSDSQIVYADRITFQRAITNIISNSVRYARTTVRFRVYETTALFDTAEQSNTDDSIRKEYTCVAIEDDGPGIPPERRKDALIPFVRFRPENGEGDSATYLQKSTKSSTKHAGLGLGLSIVERILQQHGGAVTILQGELGGCLVKTFWPNPQNS